MRIHTLFRINLLILTVSKLSLAWTRTTIPIWKPVLNRPSRTSLAAEQQQRRFAQPRTTKKYGADSKLGSIHTERIRTAGRVGTKRFVDPCKVFVGNLPFSADETKLQEFILGTMGQSKVVLHSAKVIYDWKTGKSKGYGFVQFIDPIYATVCMDVCNGKTMDGRQLSVSQGKKKEDENQLYLKKNKKKPESEEEAIISSALDEAESEEEDEDDEKIPVFGASDEDIELDALLFGIAGDDDDDDYDGIFLERSFKDKFEEVDPELNREQRRDAARRLKRTKLPHKGFG